VLFIASGFDNGTGEIKNESDFIALFHHHPWPTFIWIIGLISLSGFFPIGHSWQWQLLSVFYINHKRWILGALIIAMIIAFCSYFRWIYAAIRYPYSSMKHPLLRTGKVGLAFALIVSSLLCLSWCFPFYEL
jgi:formate hydrogenlyase subunit 3/multisubunit Na+/H+ antiporter MnhD subunit